MDTRSWRRRFWWRWVAANAVGELVGLGTVAMLGYFVAMRFGAAHGPLPAVAFALLLVLLGGFEGLIVGLAQASVLRSRLQHVQGWVAASVIGAVVAWAASMVPGLAATARASRCTAATCSRSGTAGSR